MILVILNKDKFKYDIHSLVKAFYPKEDVSVLTNEEARDKEQDYIFKIEIDLMEEQGQIFMRIIHGDGSVVSADTKCMDGDSESSGSTNGSVASLSTPKNALKQMMYRELSKEIGHDLPWGSLTGIRPTRIPMQMLEAGKEEADIKAYMQDTFFVSDEKTELAYNIALREKKILDDINYENGYSIYLGIPFCPTTCLYWSFTSFPIVTWKKKVDAYIDCLLKEID